MDRDSLIQIHTVLFQVRYTMETKGLVEKSHFDSYDDLEVTPIHVHRSKKEHQRAILALAAALAETVASGKDSEPHKARVRLERMSVCEDPPLAKL